MNKLSILVGIFFIAISNCYAQIPIPQVDCGWRYIYDNAGNRICRCFVNCQNNNSGKRDESDTLASSPDNDTQEVFSLDLFDLYPNPTSGTFVIELNNELKSGKIIVTNNAGQVIITRDVSGKSIPFDISDQPAGSFHVQVIENKRKYLITLIKQ